MEIPSVEYDQESGSLGNSLSLFFLHATGPD